MNGWQVIRYLYHLNYLWNSQRFAYNRNVLFNLLQRYFWKHWSSLAYRRIILMEKVIGRIGLKRYWRKEKLPHYVNQKINVRLQEKKLKRMMIRKMMSCSLQVGLIYSHSYRLLLNLQVYLLSKELNLEIKLSNIKRRSLCYFAIKMVK